MSSQVYLTYENILGEDDVYELTCSTNISIMKSSTVTDLPVEDGYSIADNSFANPVKFTIQGVLTEIANLSLEYQRSPEDVIKALHFIMDNGGLVTLSLDEDLNVYDNVVIERFDIKKTSGMGNAWSADISLKQVIVTAKASNVVFPPQSPETKEQADAKSKQGDNSTESKEITFSLFTTLGSEFVSTSPFAQGAAYVGNTVKDSLGYFSEGGD